MSHHLTQPEEVDHALMEMSEQGMNTSVPTDAMKSPYESGNYLRCGNNPGKLPEQD